MDWAQTRYIVANADRFHETNPILGRHPSMGKVNAYFATALVGNYVIGDWLSPKYRTVWFIGVGAVEGVSIYHNYQLGIGMNF